jgi:hypothetical protein
VAIRRVTAATFGGGLLSALAITGWPALALVSAVAIVAVVAICWVLNNGDRPKRLALLIRAWRDSRPRPTTRARETAQADRHRDWNSSRPAD